MQVAVSAVQVFGRRKKSKPSRKSISNELSVPNNSNCYLLGVLG